MLRKLTGTAWTCIFLGCILITYLAVPTLYQSLSHRLFTVLYGYHAPERSIPLYRPGTFPTRDGVERIRVLARPPQTPYDTLITTVASLEGDPIGRYVFNADGVPVGRVLGQHRSVYQVVLFSSPKSEELFAVGDYVTIGVGAGSGSFVLSVPTSQNTITGAPIRHQKTGVTVSAVSLVADSSKETMQAITGIIASNPLTTADLFVFAKEQYPDEATIESAVEEMVDEVQDEQVEQES